MAGEAERTDLLPLFGNPRIHRRYQDDYFGPLIDALFADRTPAGAGWLAFTGGTLDTELVTLGSRVYEFDTAAAPGAVTAGNVRVDVSGGATATQSAVALLAAVNGDADREVDAVIMSNGDVVGFVSRTHVGDVAAALVCTTTVAASVVSAGGTLLAADTPQEYTGCRGVSALPAGAAAVFGAGDSVPVAAIDSATRPDWLQVQAYTPGVGNLLAPVPLVATVTFEWIQANAGRWVLEVADNAATLTDGDEIHWQASVR